MSTEEEDPLERRREELRRIVYGAPGEPADDVAAELAAVERELEGHDAARSAGAEASDSPARWTDESGAPIGEADDEVDGTTADPDAAPDAARPARAPGRRLLIAAIAVLVLIVAGIAVIGPVRELLSPPRGLGVFERPATAEELELADRVAAATDLDAEDASTLRAVGRVFGHWFWVHRDGDQVCLLSQRDFFFEWVSACTTLEEFRRSGLRRWIAGDDIRDSARPPRIRPEDLVEVFWGPQSIEVEWRVLPAL
jgi:hypothetical protein